MTLNIKELINIFDFEGSAGKHVSSIKGLFAEELLIYLLVKCLNERPDTLPVKKVLRSCTTGNRRGSRLDAWVHVEGSDSFQVEVKSWSSHGYGGRILKPAKDEVERRTRSQAAWKGCWNETENRFAAPQLDKVLRRMKLPDDLRKGGVDERDVRPLACVWTSLHPDGDSVPLFRVPVGPRNEQCDFPEVWVFSARTYLEDRMNRGESECITVELPEFSERVQYLNRIFPNS